MKPAIFIAISTIVLMAQQALPTTSWDWVIQGGALGILGFAVVWGMTRTIPAMNKSHEEERQQFWARMDRWEQGSREDSGRLNDSIQSQTKLLQTFDHTLGEVLKRPCVRKQPVDAGGD